MNRVAYHGFYLFGFYLDEQLLFCYTNYVKMSCFQRMQKASPFIDFGSTLMHTNILSMGQRITELAKVRRLFFVVFITYIVEFSKTFIHNQYT